MPAPVLAAPLVIPFAEAIGVSIAALGMAKATDKVNEFIQENPEQSMKIFQMIMPSQGIANALKNKSSEGDEEVSEDIDVEVEEKPKKLTGREKGMRIKEAIRRARAGRGNYSSPDAEGSAVDIRGSVIREVEDMGIADKDLKDNYDPDKPKFDYKKFFKKRYADGGSIGIEVLFEEKKPRKDFNTGGRATTQDFANALKSVSAGTTYQQQRQAKDYARQEASNLLSQAMRSGNQQGIQNLYNQFGFNATAPGSQLFNRGTTSGTLNQITGLSAANRNRVLDQMANKMLNTTSYGGGSSAPPQKSPLQLKIEENKRLYDEYVKNNAPQIGLLPGSQGGAPTPPKPEYEDQALLSKLTMLTPEEAFAGETFDTLSDLDQYNFAQAFSQFQPQLRDSSYVSPYGAPSGRDIFSRRYGIKDGGRVGLFMGGPALEGPALGIYNSMKAYQSFTDQEIADAIRQAGYELPTADSGTTPPGSTPGNNLDYQSGNERQGGIMDLDLYSNVVSPRNISNTSSKYSAAEIEKGIDIFGNPIDESITSKGFIGSAMDKFSDLPGIKQGKNLIGTIMDNTLVGRLAAARNPLNPNASNYNPSLQGQIDMLGNMTGSRITGTSDNLKTTEGLAMIGRDPNSGLGKYGPGSVLAGQNVVSGFGTNDYEDQLQGYIDTMISRGTLSTFQKAKLAQAYKELEKAQQGALDRVDALNKQKAAAKAAGEAKKARDLQIAAAAKAQEISRQEARRQQEAIDRENSPGGGSGGGGFNSDNSSGYDGGNFCFDPSTPIQMSDGSTKEIKNIKLGDDTKGGEVTGVFQFKALDEIHDYKGVTVAGSHFVKEDGKFIMVKDSPLAVKIDKIPVVYSLDTSDRRIFIKDIEFADYNGDGVAKNFLTNAGVDLTGFDTEVLRQVENRLI